MSSSFSQTCLRVNCTSARAWMGNQKLHPRFHIACEQCSSVCTFGTPIGDCHFFRVFWGHMPNLQQKEAVGVDWHFGRRYFRMASTEGLCSLFSVILGSKYDRSERVCNGALCFLRFWFCTVRDLSIVHAQVKTSPWMRRVVGSGQYDTWTWDFRLSFTYYIHPNSVFPIYLPLIDVWFWGQ